MEPEAVTFLALVLAAVALWWMLRTQSANRRRGWLASIAERFSSTVGEDGDNRHIDVEVAGRSFTISHRYLSGGMSSDSGLGWRVVISIPLRGVEDIYNFRFERDRSEDGFRARTFGFEPRAGWMTDELRAALGAFFRTSETRDPLDVEGGHLIYRLSGRPSADVVRAVVYRQVEVAAALERAL